VFKALKKIQEYVKLGTAIDGTNIQLDELKLEFEKSYNISECNEKLISLSFLVRREIMDRVDEYDWNLEGPIKVRSMYLSNITLLEAFNTILIKVKSLSEMLQDDIQYTIQDILEGGNSYYELAKFMGNKK